MPEQIQHDAKVFNIHTLNTNQNLLLTYGQTALLFTRPDLASPSFQYQHSLSITCGTYLPKKNLLILTDILKKMLIFDVATNELKSTRNIQKRAAKLIYNKDETELLIADKTGDVYTLNLDDYDKNDIKLLMGHLSMLTDLKLTDNEKFLITSDRDEKIRISHWMNSYNIKSYLLGHKEFVTKIELINDQRLLSCSGDAKLILWDLKTNMPKQVVNTLDFLKTEDDGFVSKGVDRLDFDSETKRVVAHLYKSKSILEFVLDGDELKFVGELNNESRIDYLVRVFDNFYLMVSDKKFLIKTISAEGLKSPKESRDKLDKLEAYLNDNVNLENVQNEIEQDFESLFKNIIYSNVETYYERKMERIEATTGAKKPKINA